MNSEKRYNVLFIDDREEDNYLCKVIIELENLPMDGHFVDNGVAALLHLERAIEDENVPFPDIIISDIKMPIMDGFEFAKRFGDLYAESHPDTHFFITSSSIRQSDETRAKNMPVVTDFFRKPFSKQVFDNIKKRYLEPSPEIE